jgi:hypothetical protein
MDYATCATCGNPVATAKRRYCSDRCYPHLPAKVAPRTVSPSTLGAISELVASANLARKGFDVFRAISPACPCDLIAFKGGVSVRVEVRTAYVAHDGCIRAGIYTKDKGSFDVLAAVIDGTQVAYWPELDGSNPAPFHPSVIAKAAQAIG